MSHLQRMEEIKRRIQSKKKQDEEQHTPVEPLATPSKTEVAAEPMHPDQPKTNELPAVNLNEEVFLNTRSHKKGQLEPIDDNLTRRQHHHHGKHENEQMTEEKFSVPYQDRNEAEEESASAQSNSKDTRVKLSAGIKLKLRNQRKSSKSQSSQQEQSTAKPIDVPHAAQHQEATKHQNKGKDEEESAEHRRWKKKLVAADVELPSTVATEKPSGKTNAEAGVARGLSPVVSGFGGADDPAVKAANISDSKTPEQITVHHPKDETSTVKETGTLQVPPTSLEGEVCPTPANSEEEELQEELVKSIEHEKQTGKHNQKYQEAASSDFEPKPSSVKEHEEEEQIHPEPVQLIVPVRKVDRLVEKTAMKEQEKFRRAVLHLRVVVAAAEAKYPHIAASFQAPSHSLLTQALPRTTMLG